MTSTRIQIIGDGPTPRAYHAHTQPDGSVVEVVADLPNASALSAPPRTVGGATWIDVRCPDPNCGAVTIYPSNGDDDARDVHARYAADSARGDPRRPPASLNAWVENAWARSAAGLAEAPGHSHLAVRRQPHGPPVRSA